MAQKSTTRRDVGFFVALSRVSNSEREFTARTVVMVVRVRDDESERNARSSIRAPLVTNPTSEKAVDCHIIE